MAMLEMSVLDRTGDTKITWDSTKPDEVDHARRTFDEFRQKGYRGFLTSGKHGQKTGAALTEFDPNAEGLVMMIPAMVPG